MTAGFKKNNLFFKFNNIFVTCFFNPNPKSSFGTASCEAYAQDTLPG